jgi:hypothetical protein
MSKNIAFRVHNESSQSERRAILRNEREVGTYHAFATSEAGAIGGRFAAEAKTRVTGVAPVPQYPAQPANSPWADEPVGLEQPLGYSVEETPAVGEAFELERSLSLAESRGGEGVKLPRTLPPSDRSSGDVEALRGSNLPAAVSRPRRRHLPVRKQAED